MKEFSNNFAVLVREFENGASFIPHRHWPDIGVNQENVGHVHEIPYMLERYFNAPQKGYYLLPDEEEAGAGVEWISFYFTSLSEKELLQKMLDHANKQKDKFENFLNLVEAQETVKESLKGEDEDLLEALEKVSK